MKSRRFAISVLSMMCCLSWSVNVIAADYDPTIERVQLELITLGYDAGPADGDMREKTGVALRAYQEANKLEATGTVDEATLKKLKIGPPEVKCSGIKCTIKYGLTDDIFEEVKRYLSENERAREVSLSLGTNTDLKKLPALGDLLTRLEVSNSNYITDITPLGELTNLEMLRLTYLRTLTDITPLNELQGLKELSLATLGQPVDIAPLATLANLEMLNLGPLNTDVEETFTSSLLGGKPSLKQLRLTLVKFDDLSALQDSTELKDVYIEKVTASDIAFLAACKNITSLKLLNFPATDLNPVGELSELHDISIRDLGVTDLSFLTSLQKLKSLSLASIPATDLSPVGALTELTHVYLFAPLAFDDYAPLAKCTKLEQLQAAKTESGFNRLEVITAMPNLKALYLDDNLNIQDWDALATAVNLQILALKGTSFSDLNLLANMPKLFSLSLEKCTVTNVEAILDKPIKTLYIKGTQGIDDLTIFKALPTLDKLNVNYDKDQFPQDQIDALNSAIEEAKKSK